MLLLFVPPHQGKTYTVCQKKVSKPISSNPQNQYTTWPGDHVRKGFLSLCITGILLLTLIPFDVSAEEGYDSVSGAVKMREKTLYVTVYYYEGETAWAQYILDISQEVLPLLEGLAGFPYPQAYDIAIYAKSDEEMEQWSGTNWGRDGIWINRDMYTPELIENWPGTSTIIHEHAHHWANARIYKEKWLREGFAQLFTYLIFEKTNRTEYADFEEREWSFKFSIYQSFDFPLDEWDNKDTGPPDEGVTPFAYGKSAFFCYELYKKNGLYSIQKVNRYLCEKSIKADSLEYMEILEQFTGKDQKEQFIGWVFPEGLSAQKWKEAERLVAELEQLKNLSESSIKENHGVDVYFSTRIGEAEILIEKFEFQRAIEILSEDIGRINEKVSEFEENVTEYREAEEYYNSKSVIFEKTVPKTTLGFAQVNLTTFNDDLFHERLDEFYEEMEKLEEYYPELEALYNELIVREDFASLEDSVQLISEGDYEAALSELKEIKTLIRMYEATEKEVETIDFFTELGLSVLSENATNFADDLSTAKEEIRNRNYENASSILNQVHEKLSKAGKYGVTIIVVGVIFVAGVLSTIVFLVKRSHKKKAQ